ncbi:MAG TPA: hypothetical protein VNN07_01140 [Candidatus Tectomicrobia bacterium]|nr:hypothetical protein [Candidatus Tectomicrobia bacterium]
MRAFALLPALLTVGLAACATTRTVVVVATPTPQPPPTATATPDPMICTWELYQVEAGQSVQIGQMFGRQERARVTVLQVQSGEDMGALLRLLAAAQGIPLPLLSGDLDIGVWHEGLYERTSDATYWPGAALTLDNTYSLVTPKTVRVEFCGRGPLLR